MSIEVLALVRLPPERLAALAATGYVVREGAKYPSRMEALRASGGVRAVLTNGRGGLSGEEMQLLPKLDALPLPSDPVLGNTTINVGVFRAGIEANIIPAEAEGEMMIRLVGDKEPIQNMIEQWAAGVAELEYGSHIPPQRFHTLPGFKTAPVAFTTDIPLLSRWGTPLLFGPGSIHVAHTPDERIAVPELRDSVDTYVRLVRTLIDS